MSLFASATVPRTTWLLPVHNGERFLERALASIAAQHDRDFEVLAFNDGSRDETAAILDAWIGGHPGKRLPGRVIHSEQVGVGAALGRLVSEARSPWLARIDADDIALPERLGLQIAHAEGTPDLTVIGGRAALIDEVGEIIGDPEAYVPPLDDATLRWTLRFGNPMVHPAVLMRRDAVLAAGNYAPITPGQDHDLWVRLASRGCRFANVPETVLHYRRHANSVTSREHATARERFDQRRADLIDRMMPGLEAKTALRLLRVAEGREQPRPGDTHRLNDAARRAALASGLPVDAFVRTALFREQVARCTLAPVWTRYLSRWRSGMRRQAA